MMRSRKTKEKKEKKYPLFEKAEKLVELCADEGIFHTKTDCDDRDDCDYCSMRTECHALWFNYACYIRTGNSNYTLEGFQTKLERIKKAKHSKKR